MKICNVVCQPDDQWATEERLPTLQLPARHRRCCDVSNPTFLYDVVQCPHDLFWRRRIVESMNLQHVYVCSQPFDARLDGVEDVLAAETCTICHRTVLRVHQNIVAWSRGLIVNTKIALCHQDQLRSRDRVLLNCFAYQALRDTIRICVSCVPSVDATVKGVFQQRQRGFFIKDLRRRLDRTRNRCLAGIFQAYPVLPP